VQPLKPRPTFEQVLEHERGPVVAVTFPGTYRPGSEGNDDAATMVAYLRYVLSATKPAAVIFDVRDLEYSWGDGIGGLALALFERSTSFCPSAIVAVGPTARSLQPLLDRPFAFGIAGTKMFGTVPEAIAHLERALATKPLGLADAPVSASTPGPPAGQLKAYWAYAFASYKPIEAIAAAWNEAGPWQWQARDSHWYGDYLNTRPVEGTRVRIHEASHKPDGSAAERSLFDWIGHFFAQIRGGAQRYTALLQIEGDSPATRAEVDGVLRGLLEKIAATRIRTIEPYD